VRNVRPGAEYRLQDADDHAKFASHRHRVPVRPITTLAYLTLKASENADASALFIFTMFSNVAGSIGISLATVSIVERTQANMAHMSEHTTPLNPNYNDSIQRLTHTLMDMGQTCSRP
jgi:DHA2 family multidrug resistance protein